MGMLTRSRPDASGACAPAAAFAHQALRHRRRVKKKKPRESASHSALLAPTPTSAIGRAAPDAISAKQTKVPTTCRRPVAAMEPPGSGSDTQDHGWQTTNNLFGQI